MDETTYTKLIEEAFRCIEDALEEVDANDVDCERTGDVMTFSFHGGTRCVLNSQRPTRQLWLAANARAWHFRYDSPKRAWIDEKDANSSLYGVFAKIIKESAGLDLDLRDDA